MLIELDGHNHSRPSSSLAPNAMAIRGFNIQGEFSTTDFPPTLTRSTWKEMELHKLRR